MTGDTRGRNAEPLEAHPEFRGQSDDFAADSSGVGDGDGVLSDPIARIDDPTAMHGKLARHIPAVVAPVASSKVTPATAFTPVKSRRRVGHSAVAGTLYGSCQ